MEDVTMYEALRDMLTFMLDAVIAFFNSSPGIYLWALVLVFFLLGIFCNILKEFLLFTRERR